MTVRPDTAGLDDLTHLGGTSEDVNREHGAEDGLRPDTAPRQLRPPPLTAMDYRVHRFDDFRRVDGERPGIDVDEEGDGAFVEDDVR